MDLPEGFQSKTYIKVWYSDLGRLAAKHFNCSIEMHNVLDYPSQDTYYTPNVPSDRDWTYVWNEEQEVYIDSPDRGNEIRRELASGNSNSLTLEVLLDLLYEDSVIPSGEYLVTVWW